MIEHHPYGDFFPKNAKYMIVGSFPIGKLTNGIILSGGFAPTTEGNPRPYGMPPFGHTHSDSEVAAIATYVRNAWGHNAGAVMPLDVQKTR